MYTINRGNNNSIKLLEGDMVEADFKEKIKRAQEKEFDLKSFDEDRCMKQCTLVLQELFSGYNLKSLCNSVLTFDYMTKEEVFDALCYFVGFFKTYLDLHED